MTTKQRRFSPPRSVYEYGFDADGPIRQAGTVSGCLLGWDALDAHTESLTYGKPCEFVVVGEDIRDDGMRFPILGVSPLYMENLGYTAKTNKDGFITGWTRP